MNATSTTNDRRRKCCVSGIAAVIVCLTLSGHRPDAAVTPLDCIPGSDSRAQGHARSSFADKVEPDRHAVSLLQAPLRFEEVADPASPVRFVARSAGYGVQLSSREATITVFDRSPEADSIGPIASNDLGGGAVVRVGFGRPDRVPRLRPLDKLPGKTNYFTGQRQADWRTDVEGFARVRYAEVYPGVDLVFYGKSGQVAFDFVLAPGADPEQITLTYSGVDRLSIDADGNLILRAGGREVIQRTPFVYQETDGVRRQVHGAYKVLDGARVTFDLAEYDRRSELVIDPAIVAAQQLGGNDSEQVEAIELDSSGDVYVAGWTYSSDFPATPGAYNVSLGTATRKAFVAKFDGMTHDLIWASYLGGSLSTLALGLAVNPSTGQVYLTGYTNADDFPLQNAIQATRGGGADVFIASLDPTGSNLVFSTYVGGTGNDAGHGIVLDTADDLFVAATTLSPDFVTTVGAYDRDCGLDGQCDASGYAWSDCVVMKLGGAGSTLIYSTFLGGSAGESLPSIAVDGSGRAVVAGVTSSSDFPTLNAVQDVFGGTADAFVTRLNFTGSAVEFSTYIGGSRSESTGGVAVDGLDRVHVIGTSESQDFPVSNAWDPSRSGWREAFLVRLDPTGTQTEYSTFVGGETANDLALDDVGGVWITGGHINPSPWPGQLQPWAGNRDATLWRYRHGSGVDFGTNLGGSAVDESFAVAVDSSGEQIYFGGLTTSVDFPQLGPVIGDPDLTSGFVAHIDWTQHTADLEVAKTGSVLSGARIQYSITVTNHGPDDATNVAVVDDLPGTVTYESYTSSQAACNHAVGTVTCDIPTLSPGSDATIIITTQGHVSETHFPNSVTVSADEPDPVPANNEADVPVTLGTDVDLNVWMIVDPALEVMQYEPLTWTVVIDNYGPANANDVVMTDVLPTGVSFVSATPTQGSCSHSAGEVTCDLGGMLTNDEVRVDIQVTPNALGSIVNSATAYSNNFDPNYWNNEGIGPVQIVPRVDLQVGKFSSGTPHAGQVFTYHVGVENFGPDPATNVILQDVFLSGAFNVVSMTPTQGSCTQQSDRVVCELGTVPSATLAEATIDVLPLRGGNVINQAFATTDDPERDLANNRETLEVVFGADIDPGIIGMTADSHALTYQPIQYSIEVTNSGPHYASGVVLTQTFNLDVDVNSMAPDQGSCIATSGGGGGGGPEQVECQLGPLGVGQQVTVDIEVSSQVSGILDATAEVTSGALLEQDNNPGDNIAQAQTLVTERADLRVEPSDLLDPVVVGNTLAYRVRVANGGPDPATGVTLTDIIPAGATFVSAEASQGSCSETAGTVTCDLSQVDQDAFVTVKVLPQSPGSISNSASVAANEIDDNPSDNAALEMSTVLSVAPYEFVIHDLGALGGVESRAYAVNEAGQVVGSYRPDPSPSRGFIYDTTSGMQDIGNLDPSDVEAYDINDSGRVVGRSGTRAFTWNVIDGIQELPALSDPTLPFATALGINQSGRPVGYSSTDTGEGTLAVRFDPIANLGSLNGFSEAHAINDSGRAVGRYSGGAFVFDDVMGMQDLAGLAGLAPRAFDINEAGDVVGKWRPDTNTPFHAFLYTPTGGYTSFGDLLDLDTLSGSTAEANALNEWRAVVGYSEVVGNGEQHATLWRGATAYDLNAFLPPFSGWDNLQVATDVNDNGQIVGYGSIGGAIHGFLLIANCVDADADGYGNPGHVMCVAGPPQDCDDVEQNINPAAIEICDGQDNNCDTQIDEDADQDGEGPCEGDCDESDPNTNTLGFELCDGQDNDCDGEIDDGYDLDADGFTICAGDCDDGDGLTFPGAAETNDGQDNQCEGDTGYGLIDEIGPTLLFADGTTLQWTAQNWALGYELVRSDVPSFTNGCASSLHGGTTVSVTEAPASDSLHYFLVRSLTVSAGSWGRNSAGVERTPCLGCPHDTCTAGDALPAACDTCVTQICQLDPQCCSGSWGQACIDAVFSVCGTVVCETGSCAHSLCENGSALTPGCDEPPITPSCVTEVCSADSYCCNSAWDSLCVDEVTSICGLSCE